MLRKLLFWTHLTAGLTAGAVILMMSATGLVLTYEAQWIRWAENRLAVSPSEGESPLTLEEVWAKATAAGNDQFGSFSPSSVVLRPEPGAPLLVSGGRSQRLYLDPYEGEFLGTGFPRLEGFLNATLGWHRWFNLQGDRRRQGRAWTGAANLVFLFVLCSGLILWIPRTRTWPQFKQVLLFRRGLRPKARDFNWHNVLGIWSAIPLIVIVASGAVISYAWAGDLVSWAAGDEAGTPRAELPLRTPTGSSDPAPDPLAAIRAAAASTGKGGGTWEEINVTLPPPGDSTLSARVYRGYRGQPQLEETLTLDLRTGVVVDRTGFENQARARRYRSFLRFAHTGEYWGLFGQTVAGIVSLAAVVLGITGASLALRRLAAFRRRRRSG